MTKGITNRQMFFIIFMTLTTFSTIELPKTIAEAAGRSGWIPIIITAIVFGVSAVIITKLNNMYSGKVLFAYSQEIVGKFFTYIITSYLILYFCMIGAFLQTQMIEVISSNFLLKTPKFVLLMVGMGVFAYAAYKGITSFARITEIFGTAFIIITVVTCVFMVAEGTKYNVMPFFNPAEIQGFAKAFKELIFSYGGIEVLFVIPFTGKNRQAPKTAFLTLLFIGLFYVLLVESALMILGINNTIVLNHSFVEAIKITEVPVIERLDIFYLTFGLASLFSGMIIVLLAITEFACQIFPTLPRHTMVIAIYLILLILCLIALEIKDLERVFMSFSYILIAISSLVIPITLYLIAKVKQRV